MTNDCQKIRITFFLIVSFCCLISALSFSQNVNWVSSTEQHKWETQMPVTLKNITQGVTCNVDILIAEKQQTIEGWGGCFNELGWDALQILDAKQKETVLKSLFDPKDGLKFTICRMPIGANDYSRNWYSLNESKGDFKMTHFSIDREKEVLLPYIKEAMKYQPKLKLWASPWSPPTWMKTNHHYANKPGNYNDLTPQNAVLSGDQFIQDKQYLSAYALYLSKFVQEFRKTGIDVYAVHFQNEPYTLAQWPNCSWTPPAMRDFIAKYLGPTFEKEKVKAQIWLGTWNTDKLANFDTVFSSPQAMKYIAGAGIQWDTKNIVNQLHKKYPAIKLIQTESECGNGDFAWKDAEHLFDLMKTYLDGGVSAYTYWNMILADKGTSTWGWNQNALIQIDKASKLITYTPEYYTFKHFSNFVTPGSVKVTSMGSFKNVVAFTNTKGETIVVAENPLNTTQLINVKVGDHYFTATLRAKSFNTFIVAKGAVK